MNMLPPSPIMQMARAAGWTFIHFVWQGALVSVLLACVLALMNGRSARSRYRVACFALVLMAMLPLITFTNIVATQSASARAFSAVMPLQIASFGRIVTSHPESLLSHIVAALDHSLPSIVALWFVGVVFLSSRLGLGLITVERMVQASTYFESRELLMAFDQVARRVGLEQPVRLLQSAIVEVPTVVGWIRPVILIPLGCFTGLSPIQIEAVLAHEIAHILRHDYLVSVLQSAVEALLFYHPAVWWISRTIRIEREHCCDDLAVQYTGNPLVLARALSLLEEHRSALPGLALGATGGVLTARIKRLLGFRERAASPQAAALILIGIVIIATAVCAAATARAQNKPLELQRVQQTSPLITVPTIPSQYQAWLDQDVRWLILSQERAAFYQLTNDAERDRFVEQFWEKRNSPGSAPNSYRSENYRRIAYANQHFTESLTGWETDRGHIYVVNGPPATIEAHPASAPYGHAYEVWSYAAMQVTFVNFCDCGNYHLLDLDPTSSQYLGPVADILSDTQGVDFGPYMKLALQIIGERWLSSARMGVAHIKQTETAIRFTISQDGTVSAMVLVDSAHSIEIDRAAWAAVAGVGKFPVLPADFSGTNLVIRVSFTTIPH